MPTPRISEAESRVMAVVWDAGGAGADAILTALMAAEGWSESTIRTLIHRLIRKQALRSERRRGSVVYAPVLTREAWLTAESQGLLDRLFGGRIASLVGHMARERAMAPEDVARLKRLVAELDDDEED